MGNDGINPSTHHLLTILSKGYLADVIDIIILPRPYAMDSSIEYKLVWRAKHIRIGRTEALHWDDGMGVPVPATMISV